MKKSIPIYFSIFIFLFSFFLTAQASSGEDTMRKLGQTEREDLLSRLKSIQAGIKTFEAHFNEERTIASLPTPLMYEGTVYYEKNHLFFMKYARPVQYILQVKGNEAVIYVIGSGTADIADISQNAEMGNHADIFDWDPSQFKGEIYSDGNRFWFKAAPQQPGAQRLDIFLDAHTLLVNQFSFTSENGDSTKIIFSDKKINTPLPPGIVNFTLPKGTKLNRLSPP